MPVTPSLRKRGTGAEPEADASALASAAVERRQASAPLLDPPPQAGRRTGERAASDDAVSRGSAFRRSASLAFWREDSFLRFVPRPRMPSHRENGCVCVRRARVPAPPQGMSFMRRARRMSREKLRGARDEIISSSRTIPVRSACGGFRWCRHRSRRAWRRAAAGRPDNR